MKVLLDTSFAARGPSGTQVYIEALVPALRGLGVAVAEASGRAGRHLDLVAEARWQARLARAARGADVLHHPLPALGLPARTPQVITVMDLAFERLPEGFNARFRAFARVQHRAAARAAAQVVTPSAATAADVRELWGVDRVTVAPLGPGQAPPANRGAARHFLYVGDAEPRKNLGRLLAAYARYRDTADDPLDLVVAGAAARAERRADATAAAHGAAPHPGVRWEPAPDLADLHRHAAALCLVSLHEGFGLPVLEAMHAGTPVLASNIPALREVAGDAARYADPRDPESIAAALTELATVPPLREALRRRGTGRAAQFTWERCARRHVVAYEAAISLSGA